MDLGLEIKLIKSEQDRSDSNILKVAENNVFLTSIVYFYHLQYKTIS